MATSWSLQSPSVVTGTQNLTNLTIYLPLYKAILEGSREEVESWIKATPSALEAPITVNLDTALHVAVGMGKANSIVEFLIERMTMDQVGSQNSNGDTALSIAAIVGNVEAAKLIVAKNQNLIRVKNRDCRVPLLEAARHGQREMIDYLLRESGDYLQVAERSADGPVAFFMNLLIIDGSYDLVLDLVQKHPGFASMEYYGGDSLLSCLAAKPSAFPSERKSKFWHQLIYMWVPVESNSSQDLQPNTVDTDDENLDNCTPLRLLKFRDNSSVCCKFMVLCHQILWRMLKKVKFVKDMADQKLRDIQILQLVSLLCTKITRLDHAKASSILSRPLFLAAKFGIYEIVEEILRSFPDALWFSDAENHNVFQIAVLNRQEHIFNLIYQVGHYKHLLLVSQDTSGNNVLHLAGKLAPQHRLNLISGSAFQMQRELQWFKEVEKIVQPSYKEDRNSNDKTPAMVFTDEHHKLVKAGEKWMKDTANSCTVAAALIATVVFAAAITVPGGNDQYQGNPIFYKQKAFIIFGISDALSLFSSLAAILMFLGILTARYAEGDFLLSLPKRLIFGLVSLFLSMTSMMVAFSTTIYLVFCNKRAAMLIPVGILACLPVSLFVTLQFPLLVDMIFSTYKPGTFIRKSQHMLY